MNYTPELFYLSLISTGTALMWVPYVIARMAKFGLMKPLGNPGPGYPVDSPWMDRARRAHLNAIENLAVFAPIVLVTAVAGVSTPATVLASQVYAVARLAHYVIYIAGIPLIRTLAFFVGAVATLVIAVVFFYLSTLDASTGIEAVPDKAR